MLWVFAVASPDGRAYLQLFLDLDILQFCARGSSLRGEIRFRTPAHLASGGARVWHHVLLGHSRPKSRILGTKDKLCLWVDGELADTVKVGYCCSATAVGSKGYDSSIGYLPVCADWIGMDWIGLDCSRFCGIGLDWIGWLDEERKIKRR